MTLGIIFNTGYQIIWILRQNNDQDRRARANCNERNNIERIDIGVPLSFGVNYLYRLDIDC
ncbi:hypothetical protein D5F51_05710 [Yersinia hibernica]|uniref:Uncharacterized protein n=2 Tax=Yersinia TaxID=629 RepID=A0ABX5QYP4_9GAMM|nr:hypothetical protein LC20_03562 [Yersinia hibernica]OVZ92751.1 hypothetical protein CBW54_03255 [Yersinia kristensenii]QAX78090.1 hypothetical protein D5F51_05710 [Yersinia hibernica]